jgi:hypothetical protein
MSNVAWNYIVPIRLPADLKGIEPGKLPNHLLRNLKGGGKLHWLAAASWEAMVEKAKSDGVLLKPTSLGDLYRDYESQKRGFLQRYQTEPIAGVKPRTFEGKKWYLKKGMAPLATPGRSNHNLGLAVDVHSASEPRRIKWLIDNVKTFGWSWEVVPEEPWHIRYVAGDNIPEAVKEYMQSNNISAPTAAPAPPKAPEAPRPRPINEPVVRLGDRGPQVRKMQINLSRKGHQVRADGRFDQSTMNVLKQFQSRNGINPNGVCDQDTWRVLLS